MYGIYKPVCKSSGNSCFALGGFDWVSKPHRFFSVNNTVLCLHTSQTMHLPLTFLPHLSSLLPLLKTAGISHKKVFRVKTSACRNETLKNHPNKWTTRAVHNFFHLGGGNVICEHEVIYPRGVWGHAPPGNF